VREATVNTGAACVTAMLAVETYAWEAAAAWDNTTLHVKDVDDRATLAEREVLERVSRAEADNAATLSSTCEDTKGFA
jgi:hypothetical protein